MAGHIKLQNSAGGSIPAFAYRPDGNPIEYTVFVKAGRFTVTQPDDLSFPRYFYDCCIAAAEKDDSHSVAQKLLPAEQKLESVAGKLAHWLNNPI